MSNFECDLTSDLLPIYIEKKSGEATNKYVEEHIANCPECKAIFDSMVADIAIGGESARGRKLRLNPIGKMALFVLGYLVFVIIVLIILTHFFTNGVL